MDITKYPSFIFSFSIIHHTFMYSTIQIQKKMSVILPFHHNLKKETNYTIVVHIPAKEKKILININQLFFWS